MLAECFLKRDNTFCMHFGFGVTFSRTIDTIAMNGVTIALSTIPCSASITISVSIANTAAQKELILCGCIHFLILENTSFFRNRQPVRYRKMLTVNKLLAAE